MTGAAIIWQALTILGAVGFALTAGVGLLVVVTGGAPDERDLWDEGGHVTVLPSRPYDWEADGD